MSKQHQDADPATMEDLAQEPPAADPAEFEKLARANQVPHHAGYVKAGADAISRGRQMIQQAQEARKGLDFFPPARLLHGHRP
jgi:hypothetical protein